MKLMHKFFNHVLFVTVIYLLFNLSYYELLPSVNYMWKQSIAFSVSEMYFGYFMSLVLLTTTLFMSPVFKAAYSIVLVMVFMPIATVANVIVIDYWFVVLIFLFLFLFSLISIVLKYFEPNKFYYLSNISFFESGFLKIIKVIACFFLCTFLITNFGAINFNLLSVATNVYDIRSENKMGIFDAYSTRFMLSVLSPILIFMAFKYRDMFALFLAFLISYLLFSVYAMKIQMLYFFLYSFFGYFILMRGWQFNWALNVFIVVIVMVSFFIGVLGYNLLDRFIFLPGLLNLLYLDYFSIYELNMFENSKLSIIFGGSNYDKTLGYIIDSNYFGGGMNANTGFLASSYAELGIPGLIFALSIFNFTLYTISIIEKKVKYLGVFLAISFTFELMNAPITNMFLTNSFFVIFILPYIIKRI